MSELNVQHTKIPGLLVLNIPLFEDSRGWFKENWQRAKMVKVGLPDFQPVQNNVSFNEGIGVTRGIHAEPWDKLVSVGVGSVFGAWVDLRPGSSFGDVFTTEITPGKAVFVPRGVGNAFQTLEEGSVYSYLVNEHWSPQAKEHYTFVNLEDSNLGIEWPIPIEEAIVSKADEGHPQLKDVRPMLPKRILVLGSSGQLGTSLRERMANSWPADFLSRNDLDLRDFDSVDSLDLSNVSVVINAAAYTDVDGAETGAGRRDAWATNAAGVARLAARCARSNTTLVHVSSDYVFDGDSPLAAKEDSGLSPINVYGQSKAAGDLAVSAVPRHYIIRTSWVIGQGKNFVATMADLARRGVSPQVVNDQSGRLTDCGTIVDAICHLLETQAEFGTYNVTCGGEPCAWSDIAAAVYDECGYPRELVKPVSAEIYGRGRNLASRPANSTLDLTKIKSTGFVPKPHLEIVSEVVRNSLD